MKNLITLAYFAIVLLNVTSCTNPRQFQYLQGSFDTAKLSRLVIQEPVIQIGDLLGIVVYSDNPQATAIYNQTVSASNAVTSSGSSLSSNTPSLGYLVDLQGNIVFQGLGTIHVQGLSKAALNDTLLGRLKVYLMNPYTSIRFLNYKVTVMGEVARPGVYNIPAEKVNVLEAIGLAGEVTVFGRKENVLVIRELNGKREFGRLDLRSPEIFNSPYYYLQQNDILLVDQDKNKQSINDQTTVRNIGLAASVISTLAIVYTLLR